MRAQTATGLDARFRAMGTDVHLLVVGGPDRLLDLGRSMIDELEGRWSRFLPDSEVTALNRRAGHPVLVSPDTFDLVTRAVAAWRATDGRFDPTVGAALVAHGYDRDFVSVRATRRAASPSAPAPTPAGIQVDPVICGITLPSGVVLDAGGIGKGLAADLTATRLLDGGARGALVNIGGDLRAIGEPPTDDGWVITVSDPADALVEVVRLALPDGAVATSSSLRRRWKTRTAEAHHLIDPATGRPAVTDVRSVTVVAGEAWWAEALTKSLYLLGPRGLASLDNAHAIMAMADGSRHMTDGIREVLR